MTNENIELCMTCTNSIMCPTWGDVKCLARKQRIHGHKKLVAYNGDTPEAEIFRLELEAYSAQVAQEANHASRADFATVAGSAQTAKMAAAANNAVIYISAYSNHDGSYSISNPDTLTLESISDANGNILDPAAVDLNTFTNVFLKFHQSSSDPLYFYYPVTKIYQPNASAPIFLYFDEYTLDYDADNDIT